MRTFLLSLLACLALGLPVSAQDRPSAILVLDASGSMWGQIDGTNKIVIARDVVGDLLGTLPEDQALGLMAYGHRTKGDCSDIELLAAPGASRAELAAAVEGINPVGKTPLSAAVIQAAEALKYSEEAATVILVSDGIETCDFDPCEVGRRLESTGVDFTAHVIGFDVADAETRAQLQCLAEETGGTFRTADDAGELAAALSDVAAAPPAPEPAPEPVTVTFRALDGEAGAPITEGIAWSIAAGGETLVAGTDTAAPTQELAPGTAGTATVTRLGDEAVASQDFTVAKGATLVEVVLPKYVPPATLMAPASAPAGSMVTVGFSGPRESGDFLSSASPEQDDGGYLTYSRVSDAEGDSLALRLPPEPGTVELRYVLARGQQVLARRTIEVTPVDATLTPPETAHIGGTARIDWTGPDYQGDYITVADPEAEEGRYETYAYTASGQPLALDLPATPGTYELRYVMGASRHVLARSVPFEVADAPATVTGPGEAVAGADIEVSWQGPDADNDYISIAKPGDPDNRYESYSYTRGGNPLRVEAPIVPGDYEIRYVLNRDSTVLARTPLTLTDVAAEVSAPAQVTGGTEVSVDWSGPGYDGDYIAFAEAGAPDGRYVTYSYTREGTPLDLQAPTTPGSYELRYITGNDARKLAAQAVEVTRAEASLSAPDSAPAGSALPVTWSGPDTANDYIAITRPGAEAGDYLTYTYSRSGSPLEVALPTMPGQYEIQYVLSGRPNTVLATRPIEVSEVSAELTAELTEDAITVSWSGPGQPRDYVAIATPESAAGRYLDYAYVERGDRLTLERPEEPGVYEVRYILAGRDNRILARVPLTID